MFNKLETILKTLTYSGIIIGALLTSFSVIQMAIINNNYQIWLIAGLQLFAIFAIASAVVVVFENLRIIRKNITKLTNN